MATVISVHRKPVVLLYPDGSERTAIELMKGSGETVYWDYSRFLRPPQGSRVIPFPEGALFFISPDFQEAEEKNLGHIIP